MTSRRWFVTCCAVAAALFIADLRVQPGGVTVTRAVDDLAQLAAAATAAAAALWRATRLSGRLRASWALIGAGAGSWALGAVVWSWYELVAHVESPFPSPADAGYLMFPLLTAIGVMVRPSRAFGGRAWTRIALDVLVVVVSLFAISWATALGQVYRGSTGSSLGTVVGLAYPAGDVALLTVIVIVLSYARSGGRSALGSLGLGLTAFAVADSGFAFLTATGAYRTGNLIDACWVAGLLVIACSATLDQRATNDRRQTVTEIPRSALLLPYLPAGIGLMAALRRLYDNPHDLVLLAAATVTVWLLVARQVVVLLDNRRLMARISHQALHDSLTGMGNRALLADRLQHALDLHRRDMRPISLMLIDLDDFKTVNDSLGHPSGDELLIRVGERLRAATRSGDTLARLGGDEFAVLLEDDGDTMHIAARVLASLEQPFHLDNRDVPIGASMGIAVLAPQDASVDAADMLRRADVAMYAAKRAGKSRLALYSPELGTMNSDQLDLRVQLAADLAAGRIDVALQPIHAVDGALYAVEALARWRTRDGDHVPPSRFLPVAAQLGAAATLDETVIGKAVTALRSADDSSYLAVNVSGETLNDVGFPARLAAILRERDFPPTRLVVEVLESILVEHGDTALHTLDALRALGVRIAVDDFGAGFSNLARLHLLQPDIIKIDRSLINWDMTRPHVAATLTSVVHWAHRFNALVIAEGVETQAQLDAVIASQCDAAQGYLLGAPQLHDDVDRGTRLLTSSA